jgi:hypothetical protein
MESTTFLHVGAPKCASSSIQKWLSTVASEIPDACQEKALARHDGNQGNPIYNALTLKGLLGPSEIRTLLHKQITGYVSSLSPSALLKLSDEVALECASTMLTTTCDLIFSCEGWLHASKNQVFLDKLLGIMSPPQSDRRIEVICVLRPPAKYISSAWWQWGAWSHSHSFGSYLDKLIPLTKWEEFLRPFLSDPRVSKVHILPLNPNIIKSISEIIGIKNASYTAGSANKSLCEAALYLFQKRRRLRPSARVMLNDFILSDALDRSLNTYRPTPYCLTSDETKKVYNATSESTRKLLDLLDSGIRREFLADDCWLSAAWAETIESTNPLEIPRVSYDELLDLAADLLEAHGQSLACLRRHGLVREFYSRE